jgi:uncharacterized protein involved in tolerance to divalent cations
VGAVTAAVRANHPHECPEILALAVQDGSADYLSWIKNTLKDRNAESE